MDHSILSTLDLVIIAVYLVAMVSIGLYFVRRIKGSEDYYVAGRSFGPLRQSLQFRHHGDHHRIAVSYRNVHLLRDLRTDLPHGDQV